MGNSICNYTEVFRAADLTPVLKVEWAAYWKLDTVKNVDGFKLREWWDSVEQKLPTLSKIARCVLSVPATGCDVERYFSSLKWVRDERQLSMQEDTHRAAVLLHYNSLVGDWG